MFASLATDIGPSSRRSAAPTADAVDSAVCFRRDALQASATSSGLPVSRAPRGLADLTHAVSGSGAPSLPCADQFGLGSWQIRRPVAPPPCSSACIRPTSCSRSSSPASRGRRVQSSAGRSLFSLVEDLELAVEDRYAVLEGASPRARPRTGARATSSSHASRSFMSSSFPREHPGLRRVPPRVRLRHTTRRLKLLGGTAGSRLIVHVHAWPARRPIMETRPPQQ